MNLRGILYAGSVADRVAFLLAVLLLISEMKPFSCTNYKMDYNRDSSAFRGRLDHPMMITIGREYGFGGRYVGRLIAQ